jgi:hypothetical protein
MQGLTETNTLAAMQQYENLVAESIQVLAPRAADFELATSCIKHFSAKLRAGDALNRAISSNHGVKTFYTLDRGILAAAMLLKVPASPGIKS